MNCQHLALASAVLVLATQPCFGQTDVAGKTKVAVGNGVPGISFLGKNKTGREIHDFTFLLGEDCGRNIASITVTSAQNGGAGDWDVDDNENGATNVDAVEKDDADSTPGTKARVDSGGTGAGELAPQNIAGKGIKDGATFTIEITFSGPTTNPCTLCITPTDKKGFQLCSASLPAGLMLGANDVTADNPAMVTQGLGVGVVNATGGTVTALHFLRPSGLSLGSAFEVDPDTSADWSAVSCGGPTCLLPLALPVAPGELVSFDVELPSLDLGFGTLVRVTPIVEPLPGQPFCFGDGSLATPCPCALPDFVPSPSGAPGHGCANSLDLDGAVLSASGSSSPDTLTLHVAVAPFYSGFGFVVKGNLFSPNGIANSDGVRCVSGQLIRFGGHNAGTNGDPLGHWSYPNDVQTLAVSVATLQLPGQAAFYQLFYRNAVAGFCNPATANWSNGYRVNWP
ncbi:MAG: hypothetical protein ACKVWV_04090 [Planctomycetota bacterium]